MPTELIQVILVDDHDLVRTGFRGLVAAAPDMAVCGESDSGEEAIELALSLRPDIVLMDLGMPGIGGLEASRQILAAQPSIGIVVVSAHWEEPYPSRAFESGIQGYVTKHVSSDELIEAIRAVAAGKNYVSSEVAKKMQPDKASLASSPLAALSTRELQVTTMILQGMQKQIIARILNISAKTVSTYRSRVCEKLGVKTDMELARLAARYGLVADEPPWPPDP